MPRRRPARAAVRTLTKDEDERGREVDALYALALRDARATRVEWPHVLLLLGDQVYADEDSPGDPRVHPLAAATRAGAPGEEVADFEEYTRLYRESWGEPR